MKFSPCIKQCTKDSTFCQGCGRSHVEIGETKALAKKITEHLVKYGYDDPENFLEVLNKKALDRLAKLQNNKV